MPFVKLDCDILRSTVWHDRDVRDVFLTALLLGEPMELEQPTPQLCVRGLDETGWLVPPGWYGIAKTAAIGIFVTSGIDPTAGMTALERLCAPDPDSCSRDFDGRRIARIDGGYIILNWQKYRDRDYNAMMRCRRYRERKQRHAGATRNEHVATRVWIHSGCVTLRNRTEAEAEAEAEAEKKIERELPSRSTLQGLDLQSLSMSRSYGGSAPETPQPAVPAPEHSKAKKPKTEESRSLARRWPEDFQPNSADRALAARLGLDVLSELEACADHHRSKGNHFKDHHSALRTWMRRSAGWANRSGDNKLPGFVQAELTNADHRAIAKAKARFAAQQRREKGGGDG